MERGICKLCGVNSDLQDSHLIPAGVYRYCKAPGFDPVLMTDEFILPTQRQIRAYVLCSRCEVVLNMKGERWSVPLLAEQMGRFPLYELLNKKALIDSDDTMKAYDGSMSPRIKTEMLVHLALGIFYKAAVHGWRKAATAPIINLGDALKGIGAFLLGRGPFPQKVGLLMVLMPPPVPEALFTVPKAINNGSEFFFYLPGNS